MSRNLKRAIIIAVYLAIFAGIAYWIYSANRAPSSCSDGKQNQNETGVDCGGVCGQCAPEISAKDLEILDVTLMVGGEGKYDVVAEIRNPNTLYGASEIQYEVILKDAQGDIIERVGGSTLTLPNQKRYIAELNIPSTIVPTRAELKIFDNVQWVQFTDFEDPNFVVDGSRFGLVENGINYAQAFGIIHNRSVFDFQNVDVIVVLKDPSGKPIAANKTFIGDFLASRQRDFSLAWPDRFPGEIASMDVDVIVDVYDAENFIRIFTR